MFEPRETARVFGVPPGVDFPKAVLDGLCDRIPASAPEEWGRVTLLVNTERMARRLRDLLHEGPPRLLPRIRLLTNLDDLLPGHAVPPAVSPLRRRLELARLIAVLLEQPGQTAPRASLFELADSLAKLLDELEAEDIPTRKVADLDVAEHSQHWANTKAFVGIAQDYLDQLGGAEDKEARQRTLTRKIITGWEASPPTDPVLVVGSTGSRSTTAMLMRAVARLPQGAVVLPGFDFEQTEAVWDALGQSDYALDHPQYRLMRFAAFAGLGPQDIPCWSDIAPPDVTRNKIVSLALRPAPVTHVWRKEGPKLTGLNQSLEQVTVIEATSPREEAMAIAMRLRKAAEDGQRAALVTPNRVLTRQVAAALDRWRIRPDDSGGVPLQLTPPGRFTRHVAQLLARQLDAETLLTLLKHPLTSGTDKRNLHQLNTRRFELRMRQRGLPYPDADGIKEIVRTYFDEEDDIHPWSDWLCGAICGQHVLGKHSLADWVARHLELSNRIAHGYDGMDSTLWDGEAGHKVKEVFQRLEADAAHGHDITAFDYANLFQALLQGEQVRDSVTPHAEIMIWGTLEARVQGADLVILGSLNDGTWPEAPAPDPWLNRAMRKDIGLALPEQLIGLSAHDFQQAIAAPEVWLTRSVRSDDAETVPSRWINRMQNLLNGLETTGGPEAWAAAVSRGADWLKKVDQIERADPVKKAHRPAPRPPAAARPRAISVTELRHLIRDPYTIYARHCLRLRPLDPLVPAPTALERGIQMHLALERFIAKTCTDPDQLDSDVLRKTAREVLSTDVPWPATRALWIAHLDRCADLFVAAEKGRRELATPASFEERGSLTLDDLGFTIRGRADRIDVTPEGEARLYDYKSGTPSSRSEQLHFDKQLLVEAAMIEEGAFSSLGPRRVQQASFLGLNKDATVVHAPLDKEPVPEVLANLRTLIREYLDPTKGFAARRAMHTDTQESDYDQLSRYGEWDQTQDAVSEDVA